METSPLCYWMLLGISAFVFNFSSSRPHVKSKHSTLFLVFVSLNLCFSSRTLLWTWVEPLGLKWTTEAYIWIHLRWCPLFNLDERERRPQCTNQEETWHILNYQYHSEQIHLMVSNCKSARGLEKGPFGCCLSQCLLPGSWVSLPAAQELCTPV